MTMFKAAAAAAMIVVLLASGASAQQSTANDPGSTGAASTSAAPDDAALQLAQPDFTLIALPTALRIPRGKAAFRVTHRFQRALGRGDFGDLAGDFFGLDNGAVTALELRFGLAPGTQVGVHRSGLGKTISFFGEHAFVDDSTAPIGIAVWASVDGTNNFRDSYTPAIGAILSRSIGDRAALYVEPMWVNNSNPLPKELVEDNNTVMVGLAARIRIGATAYVVGEWSPRITGFEPFVDAVSFAVEKRVGGHMFQLNFSNSFATTMGQIARGGFNNDDWYLGFNITRKFF